MAFTNFDTKEINCKVVYFGPSGAGKTTNLRSVFLKTSPEIKTGLFGMEESQAAQFFEFLPVSLGQVRDYHLKFHLFTIPNRALYESLASVVVKGIDGFVYVNDARVDAMADNIRGLAEVKRFLADEGFNVADLPRVIQYNKVDLEDAVPVDILRQELNPAGLADMEAVATQSIGTLETLHTMSKLILSQLGT